MTLFIATIFGWEAPLLAVHILWVNLATATLPALALGVDPASRNIMRHPPVKQNTLFEKDLIFRVVTQGIFVCLMTLCAYWIGAVTADTVTGQTMAFCVLAFSQMLRALNQRSNTESVFSRQGRVNWFLFLAMFLSGVILAAVVCLPTLEAFFSLVMLTAKQWEVVMLFSLLPLALVEITKFFYRLGRKRHAAN